MEDDGCAGDRPMVVLGVPSVAPANRFLVLFVVLVGSLGG